MWEECLLSGLVIPAGPGHPGWLLHSRGDTKRGWLGPWFWGLSSLSAALRVSSMQPQSLSLSAGHLMWSAESSWTSSVVDRSLVRPGNKHDISAPLYIFTILATLNVPFNSPSMLVLHKFFKNEEESHLGDKTLRDPSSHVLNLILCLHRHHCYNFSEVLLFFTFHWCFTRAISVTTFESLHRHC